MVDLRSVHAEEVSSVGALNESVLSPDYDGIEEMTGRDEQLAVLARQLAPFIEKGQPAKQIITHGRPGTGKTMVAKRIHQHVVEMTKERGAKAICLPILEVKEDETANRTYYRILAAMREDIKNRKNSGTPKDAILGQIVETVKARGAKCIFLVLDEMHRHKDANDVIATLSRFGQEYGIPVQFVLVSNSITYMDNLEPRTRSSLNEAFVTFPNYSPIDLAQIIQQRLDMAKLQGIGVQEGTVAYLGARAAVEFNGDCRDALKALQEAYNEAKRAPGRILTETEVRAAITKVTMDRHYQVVKKLGPMDLTVVLAIYTLKSHGVAEPDTNQVYTTYRYLCDQQALTPLSQDTVGRMARALQVGGVLVQRVVGRGRGKGKVGVWSIHQIEAARKVFGEDSGITSVWSDIDRIKLPPGVAPQRATKLTS